MRKSKKENPLQHNPSALRTSFLRNRKTMTSRVWSTEPIVNCPKVPSKVRNIYPPSCRLIYTPLIGPFCYSQSCPERTLCQILLLFSGKIVTIETVSVPIINGNVDATGTRWIESANDDAPYAFILRLYTVQDSSAKETLGEAHCTRITNYYTTTNNSRVVSSGGSKGGPKGRVPPPLDQNFFICMQFSQNIGQIDRLVLPPPGVSAPPLGNPRSATGVDIFL